MYAIISEQRMKRTKQLIGYVVVDTIDGCVEAVSPDFLTKLHGNPVIMGVTDGTITPLTLFDVVNAQLVEMSVVYGIQFKTSKHNIYSNVKLQELLAFIKQDYPLLYNDAQKKKNAYFPMLSIEQSVSELSSFKLPWGIFGTERNYLHSVQACKVGKFIYSNTSLVAGVSISDLNMQTECIEFSDNVKVIPPARFRNTSWLKSVIFKEGLQSIGTEAFMGTALTEVVIPSSVTDIDGEAFSDCQALKSVVFQSDFMNTLEYDLFHNCPKLENIVLPKRMNVISNGALSKTAIKTIDLPQGLCSIGASSFAECCNLEHLEIPDTVKFIHRSAFYSCSNLKSVTLSPSLTAIEESVFLQCAALKEIDMSSTNISVISNGAFGNCHSLKEVKFPDSIEYIRSNAFLCTSIEDLLFPSALRSIGFCAFKSNHFLKSLKCLGSNVSIDDDAFLDCPLLQTSLLNKKAVSAMCMNMSLKSFISLLEQCSEKKDVLQPMLNLLQTEHMMVYSGNTLSITPVSDLISDKVTTEGLALLLSGLVSVEVRFDTLKEQQLFSLFPNVDFAKFEVARRSTLLTISSRGG